MEIAFQILKQLPAGVSRIAVVAVLAVLFFLPEMRRKLTWQLWEDDRFERAKKLLELRQLQIQVEASKSEHPEAKNEYLDGQITELIAESSPGTSLKPEPIAWRHRLRHCLAGSFALMVLGTIALSLSGSFDAESPLHVIGVEMGYTAVCGFLASAIPARHAWECVFRGILIPIIIGAMVAAAIGNP